MPCRSLCQSGSQCSHTARSVGSDTGHTWDERQLLLKPVLGVLQVVPPPELWEVGVRTPQRASSYHLYSHFAAVESSHYFALLQLWHALQLNPDSLGKCLSLPVLSSSIIGLVLLCLSQKAKGGRAGQRWAQSRQKSQRLLLLYTDAAGETQEMEQHLLLGTMKFGSWTTKFTELVKYLKREVRRERLFFFLRILIF